MPPGQCSLAEVRVETGRLLAAVWGGFSSVSVSVSQIYFMKDYMMGPEVSE